jgi:hypothetical protein
MNLKAIAGSGCSSQKQKSVTGSIHLPPVVVPAAPNYHPTQGIHAQKPQDSSPDHRVFVVVQRGLETDR